MGENHSTRKQARRYIKWGWSVIPIPRREKAPILKAWQKMRLADSDVHAYFKDDDNIGILLGDLAEAGSMWISIAKNPFT